MAAIGQMVGTHFHRQATVGVTAGGGPTVVALPVRVNGGTTVCTTVCCTFGLLGLF